MTECCNSPQKNPIQQLTDMRMEAVSALRSYTTGNLDNIDLNPSSTLS